MFVTYSPKSANGNTFLDCLTLEDGTDWLSRNVSNYQPTLPNVGEERKPTLKNVPCHLLFKRANKILSSIFFNLLPQTQVKKIFNNFFFASARPRKESRMKLIKFPSIPSS
jgi:hypothetical protein